MGGESVRIAAAANRDTPDRVADLKETNLNDPMRISLRRRAVCGACLLLVVQSACEAKPMRVFLNISLFSYLDRPIFDVQMNGTDFMAALEHSFYGSNSVMLMQPITLGPQTVSWRLAGPEGAPRNGELVTAKNKPMFSSVPDGVKWLALHIYDDDMVEIRLSKGTPDELQTERGRRVIEDWKAKNGQ